MWYCMWCGKPMDAGPNDGFHHDVCDDELNRRRQENLCIICGEATAVVGGGCENCDMFTPIVGYPGP